MSNKKTRIGHVWPVLTYIYQATLWIPLYVAWKLFLRLEVRGKENLNGLKKPVIFASNHTSELDAIIIPARSINPLDSLMHMFHVSREKKFYQGSFFGRLYGGVFFKLVGAYPAVVGVFDYAKSLKNHVELLHRGKNVCVFPEGKKSMDGKLLNAKGGVVYLAEVTRLPIIPIAISGISQMTFREFILRKRKVIVSYGKPISVEELFSGEEEGDYIHYPRIANEKIMNKIGKMLQK